jgi:hypothetical protein
LTTRLLASALAVLVVALSVFAASPALHAWLHDHAATAHHGCNHAHSTPAPAPDADDESCVVTQFAHGKADCAPAPLLAPVATLRVTAFLAAAPFLAPRAPALFLPPGCGPPAA